MPVLGAATLELNADSGKLEADLGRAAHVAEKELKSIEKAAAAAGTALAGMAVAAAYGLAVTVREAINTADQMSKLSQRTGIAVETLSQMKYAADLADVSLSQMSGALTKFNLELVEAHDKGSKAGRLFTALGVDIKAGPHQAMLQFADSVRGLSSVQAQVAVVREAFGRSSPELLNFILNLRDSSEEARRMGLTMSGQLAKDANEFNDNLKRIQSSSSALGISIANEVLPHLLMLSNRFLEAKQNGEFFQGVLQKVADTAMKIPGPFAMAGNALNAMVPSRSLIPSAPAIGDLPLSGAPVGGPNTDEVMCIQSGGKWSGGKCIPKGTGRGKDGTAEAEREARRIADAEEQAAKDTTEAWGFVAAQRNKEIDDLAAGQKEMWKQIFDEIDAEQEREIEQGQRLLQSLNSEQKKINSFAKEMGLTFTSAFEDAVVGGKKLQDVLKGIGMDIAKIILRKSVTEPIGGAISGAIGSIDFKGIFGGDSSAPGTIGFAEGGRPPVGIPSIVGERGPELFIPDTAGTVVPNHALGGGTIFNVDMRGASVEAVQRLEAFVARVNGSIERRAVAASRNATRRGVPA